MFNKKFSCFLLRTTLILMFPVSQAAQAETVEGTVQYETKFELVGTGTGTVAQVHAKVGERVTEGEVLIRFDSTQREAEVEMAKNRVAKLQIATDEAAAKFARQQELFDRGSLSLLLYEESANALKNAQLDLASAQAELKIAQHLLSKTKITSPIDAIVVNSNVYPGMNIPKYECSLPPLMTVASLGRYVVKVSVTSPIWYRLTVSESVRVVVNGKNYESTVILPKLLPASRPDDDSALYPVHLSFTENDTILLPEMPATVIFD